MKMENGSLTRNATFRSQNSQEKKKGLRLFEASSSKLTRDRRIPESYFVFIFHLQTLLRSDAIQGLLTVFKIYD